MRVVVVGAGVFGAWCAKFLADSGHVVTLVDAYGPANARASSADHSRVIRAGYGTQEIYSRFATESLRDWQWLAAVTGRTLLARTGALFMGEPSSAYLRDSFHTLSTLGIAVERLAPDALRQRFPQIDATGLGDSLFEAEAGVIRARAAVQALVAHLTADQRVSYVHAAVEPVDEQQAQLRVVASERAMIADVFVFACGPWLPRIFPLAVGRRIRPTRQEVLFFGAPPGDTRFAAARLPVWIDFASGLYGIPDLDARGFKVGIDRHGAAIDPDVLERTVDEGLVHRTREWIAQRFPAMRGAPLLDAHVCQYENTSSGDFIIDRHPAWPSCWIVGGGSGHGFKHGPAVGRHVADVIDGRAPVRQPFALETKSVAAARVVY